MKFEEARCRASVTHMMQMALAKIMNDPSYHHDGRMLTPKDVKVKLDGMSEILGRMGIRTFHPNLDGVKDAQSYWEGVIQSADWLGRMLQKDESQETQKRLTRRIG